MVAEARGRSLLRRERAAGLAHAGGERMGLGRQLVEDLRAGREVTSTRGPVIRDFKACERTLSGIDDDGLGGVPATDDLMLAGLRYAQEHDMKAPEGKVI